MERERERERERELIEFLLFMQLDDNICIDDFFY